MSLFNKWTDYMFVNPRGIWVTVVGIITDKENGNRRIRIATGVVKGSVNRVGGKIEYTLINKEDPIAEILTLNILSGSVWKKIKNYVDEYMKELDKPIKVKISTI